MKKNADIPNNWKLPDAIVARLGKKAGKQRVIAEQSHTLVVLHKAPKKNEHHRESVFLWLDDKAVWSSSERGNGLAILDDYLQQYAKAEAALDKKYEQAHCAADYFDLLENVSPLQRAAKNMTHTLQSAREHVGSEMIDYRDRAEEILRNIDLLYVDCKNALEYSVAKKAEEQSLLNKKALVVSHRLNIIMALFLPITAVASLLGMNLTHGLESKNPLVFGSVVAISIVLGLVMKFWVSRKP
jgi:hypothetical protein